MASTLEAEGKKSKIESVIVSRSSNPEKKLMAVFEDAEGKKVKTTHFGQRGASDYTKHGDKERMERYLERHGGGFETSTKEDWKDPTTAGSLSRWILWNKPSLSASFADYKKRFGLKGSLTVSKSAEGLEVKNEQKFVLKNPQDYEDMMDEIRPQLEAHKVPWKLWYLERKLDGVGGKTWKRDGVYPVVIIKPNEMELKWPNGFTKYLRKQKGGMYHRVGVSGNPYKHLIYKGNHIYGNDEELEYEGKGVAWYDPKIDRNRFETLEIESLENSRLGLGKMRGVWKGRPSTPKKKDIILPPQFKKMMEDVGFSDFITKMEMGSELRLKPIWRLKDAPMGVKVDIPLEMGGNYIARDATLVEVKPADQSTVKEYLKKPQEVLSKYPNNEKAKKQVEKAKNGELLSVVFNVSHFTKGLKQKLAPYIKDEDYFVTAGFPEQILEVPYQTLKYSPEADKYYTEGQPEPHLDTTSQMLKDLGLDYQAEWAKPPKPVSRVVWRRPTPFQKKEADIVAAEVAPIDFEDLHSELLDHKKQTGKRPIEWFTEKRKKDWFQQYDFIKFLDDAGFEWSPNIVAIQENECKGVFEYNEHTFFLYQTEYLRWARKRNAHDWTATPTANTKSYWVAVAKFDKRSGEYDYVDAIFPRNNFRQGNSEWEQTIDIEYTKKKDMVPLVRTWIDRNLYRPRISTDMVEDLMVSQGQYIRPTFYISEMTLPQATEPQKVMFYYDYQEGKVHALLTQKKVGGFLFMLDNYWPLRPGIFNGRNPLYNDNKLLLPYLVAGVIIQYPVPFTEETMKEINKSPIHWINKTTGWSERELTQQEVEETALIQEMVDIVEVEPEIGIEDAWLEHLMFDYDDKEFPKQGKWVRKWPFNTNNINGGSLPRNKVQFEAKSPAQKSLDKWTNEDWGTKSGKPSTQGSQATGERYLPRKAREALTDKEYQETSAKKRRDTAKGKQFSQQPDDIEKKTAKYRSEVFEAIEGTGSNARFTDQPDPKIYRDPSLRQKARNKLLKGNKGGDEGEWSARKAQMAATEYRKMYENKYGEGKNPYFAESTHPVREEMVIQFLEQWLSDPPAGFKRNLPQADIDWDGLELKITMIPYKAGRKFFRDIFSDGQIRKGYGEMEGVLEPVSNVETDPATLIFRW